MTVSCPVVVILEKDSLALEGFAYRIKGSSGNVYLSGLVSFSENGQADSILFDLAIGKLNTQCL